MGLILIKGKAISLPTLHMEYYIMHDIQGLYCTVWLQTTDDPYSSILRLLAVLISSVSGLTLASVRLLSLKLMGEDVKTISLEIIVHYNCVHVLY